MKEEKLTYANGCTVAKLKQAHLIIVQHKAVIFCFSCICGWYFEETNMQKRMPVGRHLKNPSVAQCRSFLSVIK